MAADRTDAQVGEEPKSNEPGDSEADTCDSDILDSEALDSDLSDSEALDWNRFDWETEIAPWDGRQVPVTLIGGYLGAGKTTLVNELLALTERPIAVLVNDIGSVNVDAALIRARTTDAIELTDGCVCCEFTEGIGAAFNALRERSTPPDHVVVELSGAANPGRVTPWGNSPGFRLDGVVVTVDALAALEIDADPNEGPRFREQLAWADLAVLTKADLVDEASLARTRALVANLEPNLTIVEKSDTTTSPAHLLNLATRRPLGATAMPEPTLFDPYLVESIAVGQPTDAAGVEELLDRLTAEPGGVLRAKGIVPGIGGTKLLVQVVGRRRRIEPLTEAEDQPTTPLVVIRQQPGAA